MDFDSDKYDEYIAEREFVQACITDDDRQFDIQYLYYAHGTSRIEDLYNPHEFDTSTRFRFLNWIQCQLDNSKNEANIEDFWDDEFFRHHNVRDMYTAWKRAS